MPTTTTPPGGSTSSSRPERLPRCSSLFRIGRISRGSRAHSRGRQNHRRPRPGPRAFDETMGAQSALEVFEPSSTELSCLTWWVHSETYGRQSGALGQSQGCESLFANGEALVFSIGRRSEAIRRPPRARLSYQHTRGRVHASIGVIMYSAAATSALAAPAPRVVSEPAALAFLSNQPLCG